MSGGPAAGRCPGCGAAAEGRFCSRCGTPVDATAACRECGSSLAPGALYCRDCGASVAPRPVKGASAKLPWILSAVTLAAFSVIIALLVQGESRPRIGDMLPTGNLPGAAGASAGATGAGMPSVEELAAMGPRAAADRLFERAMREHEGGDVGRAGQFISMGLQAYAAVPPDEVDADARFHIGLLQLLMGEAEAALASAEATLGEDPDHLLALILAARVADFRQDETTASGYRARFRAVVEREGGVPAGRPEYESHRTLIDRELEGSGS